jgi:hypothetical protein
MANLFTTSIGKLDNWLVHESQNLKNSRNVYIELTGSLRTKQPLVGLQDRGYFTGDHVMKIYRFSSGKIRDQL